MGSGDITYIPDLIKIGSGIQKLMEGNTKTHTQHGDLINLHPVFFKLRKVC
jgi:hypothetical protein